MDKKILHVWELYMAGHFVEPHRFLTELNPSVKSFVVAAQGLNTPNFEHPNITYYTRGTAGEFIQPGFWRRNLRRAFSPIFWNGFNRFCYQAANEIRPDLIHAHFGTTAAQILPTLRRYRVPSVVSFYGFDASASLRSWRWKRKLAGMLKQFDHVIVLCQEVKDRLVEVLGCDPNKVLIWMLPGGIEDYPYRPRQTRKDVRFITAARFTEKKGHRFLLEAFRKFLDEHPGASLTLMGYGPSKHTVQEMIDRLNLGKSVCLIDTELKPGFPALYYKELLKSDICIQPSIVAESGDDEAGPSLSMVCAQASGLPVICTRFIGVGISMRDGETGYYCESSDSEDLYRKMKLLSSQPEKWGPMGSAGSNLARSEFSMEGQIKKLEDIYSKIADRRPLQ